MIAIIMNARCTTFFSKFIEATDHLSKDYQNRKLDGDYNDYIHPLIDFGKTIRRYTIEKKTASGKKLNGIDLHILDHNTLYVIEIQKITSKYLLLNAELYCHKHDPIKYLKLFCFVNTNLILFKHSNQKLADITEIQHKNGCSYSMRMILIAQIINHWRVILKNFASISEVPEFVTREFKCLKPVCLGKINIILVALWATISLDAKVGLFFRQKYVPYYLNNQAIQNNNK